MSKHAQSQDQRRNMLLNEPISRIIPKMAIPTIVAFLINSIYSLADTYFVSSLGTNATAAVSVNASLDQLIMMCGSMLAVGANSYIARLLGQGDETKASQVLSTAFFTAFGIGALLMVFGNLFMTPMVRMLGAMVEYLPKFRQYLKAKAKALGHANGLPWYDLFAPMGESGKKYTIEEAGALLVELFSTFDGELADMVRTAFAEEWIDFYPRSGKTGGAFCEIVSCIGESRILTNFDGMYTDVVTLAHELGHAFHNLCIMGHRPLNKDYSMPVAETASTFNECVINNAAIARAETREEKLALLESQLQDATQIICDIYSRFRFEAMVFENREQAFLDADTLCGLMTKAQEESYGDGLDPAFRHPYMWICKSHYYGPTFYNFPYAFGGLFARGLYAQYRQEGASFVPKYKKLLYTTPIATAEEAARTAGIDLTDIRFWRSALAGIGEQIDQFCQLVQEV